MRQQRIAGPTGVHPDKDCEETAGPLTMSGTFITGHSLGDWR